MFYSFMVGFSCVVLVVVGLGMMLMLGIGFVLMIAKTAALATPVQPYAIFLGIVTGIAVLGSLIIKSV